MRRGFTVIEVLMALAIFALMATVIAGGYLNVLRAYAAAADDGLADSRVRFARSEFLNTKERDALDKGGTFTDGDTKVTWSATVDPTRVPDLYRVTFVCVQEAPSWKRPLRNTEVRWLLRPAWARPNERGPIEIKFQQALQSRTDAAGGRR